MDETGAFTWTHADHLGSASAATDASGAIIWRESYLPFGEAIEDPAANRDEAGFTGHIRDAATGLTYAQARYYNPVTARFLAPDPVGFSSGGPGYFNRYAYTANDPVNLVDPTGEFIVLLANPVVRGVVGGAIGAVASATVNAGAQYVRTGRVNVGDALAAGAATGAASAANAANPALAASPGALSAIGAAAGVSGSVAGDVVNGRDINFANAAVGGLAGAVGGPGGARVGDLVENAFGAAAGSVAGETAGAIGGEVLAGSINAALPEAANAARKAGSAIADGSRAVGESIQRGIQEIQDIDPGPCIREEDGC
jgi:RHS repeat-associated protein